MFMNCVRRNVPTILSTSTRTLSLRYISSHGGPPPLGFKTVVRKYLPEVRVIIIIIMNEYGKNSYIKM